MREPIQFDSENRSTMICESFTQAIAHAHRRREDSAASMRVSGHSDKWTKTHDYAHAHELASKGWKAGRSKLAAFRGRMLNHISSAHSARLDVVHDVTGNGGIDIGRYMTGEPETFIDWQETEDITQQIGHKVVTVWVNNAYSAVVDTQVVERRGAVILALLDVLEASGYSVELWDCCRVREGAANVDIKIPIKAAGSVVQDDQITFACAHPSWLRRILFSLIRANGKYGAEAAQWSYGSPQDYEPEELEKARVDLYVPMMHAFDAQWETEQAAVAWLKAQVAAYGIKLEDKAAK